MQKGEVMRAKEYLGQVRLMNIKIDTKIKQLEELKILATCTGTINAKPDKIQSSPCGDKMENAVAKYVDLEREINNQIDAYVDKKQVIVEQIHELNAGEQTLLYMQILIKRYVEFKSLEEIAVDLDRSYAYVRHIHGEALSCFTKQFLLGK
jgi:hypothetical protein